MTERLLIGRAENAAFLSYALDAFPLLVMTTKSLHHMQRLAAESTFDVRRFRPNILIECDDDVAFPELDWLGKRLAIGDAEIEVHMPCPRCAMTTYAFGDLPKDPQIMRALVQNSDGNLGVYASVTNASSIRVGDSAQIVD